MCLDDICLFRKHQALRPDSSCPAFELLFALAISLTLAVELPFVVQFISMVTGKKMMERKGVLEEIAFFLNTLKYQDVWNMSHNFRLETFMTFIE